MFERIFALAIVAVCVFMLVRLVVGEQRRWRIDAALRRLWGRVRRGAASLRARAMALYHWRSSRRKAQQAADEAIRRASEGQWDGNVYKPKSFRRPRK